MGNLTNFIFGYIHRLNHFIISWIFVNIYKWVIISSSLKMKYLLLCIVSLGLLFLQDLLHLRPNCFVDKDGVVVLWLEK